MSNNATSQKRIDPLVPGSTDTLFDTDRGNELISIANKLRSIEAGDGIEIIVADANVIIKERV